MHRVLCIDDNRTFVELLEVVFRHEEDIESLGHVFDVAAAIPILASTDVDVVLMGHDVAGIDGIEGLRQVKRVRPGTRVVLIAEHPSLEALVRAASSGADGFLAKDSSLDELLASIRSDAFGLELSERTMNVIRERVRSDGEFLGRRWDPQLTQRERDVLALLAEGLDPQSIARHLNITAHTSRSYVRNVLAKLGAHTQLEAVVTAARAGLVTGLCCGCHDLVATGRGPEARTGT